ncbi:MAG TPA: D-glycero-beta-D-manno-heptose 1,7-bisphosphate 7-phosphatase [Longimicrobiales bacterium]|nr:D-glycero-beta-D-manno-heptose 1,7-bisphosphate 7-phosphatase [Longimicrobiales bacterium]
MSGRPAVFLDRDGTIIVEKHYLADPAGVELIPGAAEALARLARAGYALVLITNQSGIARGLYARTDFERVQQRVEALLLEQGVRLDGVYHCPHHPDFDGPCECRKPAPGLFRRAADELGLDLSGSACVGDRLSDLEAALAFGARALLVLTGHGERERRGGWPGLEVVADLGAAADRILDQRLPAGVDR